MTPDKARLEEYIEQLRYKSTKVADQPNLTETDRILAEAEVEGIRAQISYLCDVLEDCEDEAD